MITHLDVLPVLPGLVKLNPAGWKGMPYRCEIGDPRLPTRSLALRGRTDYTQETWLDDLPLSDLDPLEKWNTMKRLLEQARKAIRADPVAGQNGFIDWAAPPGRVMITGLAKGGVIMWHKDDGDYNTRHARFHLPLTTNPLVLMYSGSEVQHMPVGSLWLFNNQIMHSAANWGLHVRYHLIFELRRCQPDTEES